MYAEYEVIRSWEVPAEELLNFPGLLPFAALGRTADPAKTLRDSVRVMSTLPDEAQQHEAIGAAYILSGLRLDAETIARIIRRDVMQESVTYQAILEEGHQFGLQEGRRSMVIGLLREGISIEVIQKVSGLSIEEIQRLEKENLS
jgi:predicted transposase YdaD